MMDIFLLFVFNIFTGAVIFLILSLKIEKTSSTFQEQKLRKEMGEIITEFNSTAERNITLLENRISVLKKLLNESGSLKGVDFIVSDENMKNNSPKRNPDQSENVFPGIKGEKEQGRDIVENKSPVLKVDNTIIGNFMDKIQSINKAESVSDSKEKIRNINENEYNRKRDERNERDIKDGKLYNSSFIIEKDIRDINIRSSHIDLSADEDITLKYEKEKTVDIMELFQKTDDKYLLIAQLFNEGHSVEELSQYSGLPAGEIKLVISLNS